MELADAAIRRVGSNDAKAGFSGSNTTWVQIPKLRIHKSGVGRLTKGPSAVGLQVDTAGGRNLGD